MIWRFVSTGPLAYLPSAWVFTAEYDPLRDEGRRYAAAMEAAGVDVDVSHGSDMIHGVFGMTLESGAEVRAEAAAVLRRAFASKDPATPTGESNGGT